MFQNCFGKCLVLGTLYSVFQCFNSIDPSPPFAIFHLFLFCGSLGAVGHCEGGNFMLHLGMEKGIGCQKRLDYLST